MWKRLQRLWERILGHRMYDPLGEAYVKIWCPRSGAMLKLYPGKDRPYGISCPDCGSVLATDAQGRWVRPRILRKPRR
jgi:hypothetical protein